MAKNASYAYICDKKACDHCDALLKNASIDDSYICTHTTNPLHSITLRYGLKPVFTQLGEDVYFEVGHEIWDD